MCVGDTWFIRRDFKVYKSREKYSELSPMKRLFICPVSILILSHFFGSLTYKRSKNLIFLSTTSKSCQVASNTVNFVCFLAKRGNKKYIFICCQYVIEIFYKNIYKLHKKILFFNDNFIFLLIMLNNLNNRTQIKFNFILLSNMDIFHK